METLLPLLTLWPLPLPSWPLSSWLPLIAGIVAWVVVLVFLPSPEHDSLEAEEADETLLRHTAYAVAFAVSLWVSVAVGIGEPNVNQPGYLNVTAVLWGFAYPIGYVLSVIWLVGGQQSTLAHPVRVASFFVAAVAAHIGYFAYTYLWIDRLVPNSFGAKVNLSGPQAFYVAATTFTSVGPGDLAPVRDAARFAVATESLLSLLILAVGLGLVLRRWRPWRVPTDTVLEVDWIVKFRISGPRAIRDVPVAGPDVYTEADVERLHQRLRDGLPLGSPRRLVTAALEDGSIVGFFETSMDPFSKSEKFAMQRMTVAALLPFRRPTGFEILDNTLAR